MNQRKILLQLLPGFIPLFVFIIADEIWGTKIGLIVAVIVGIGELIFYRIKDKKFDKFILFDTLLIIALGVVSIILDNDVFFKLKPALIGVLTCVILAISAFTPSNILLNMSKRYMRGLEFNEQQYKQMKKSMKSMFYMFAVYTLLVFYSVWFMSDAAWAFISGGLFYIIFGIYFVYEFVKNKIAQKKHLQKQNPKNKPE
ncbi:MAG: septation protein IspZ [Bacteroidales bacterium]|nr:septation protein IspZ [Bacteroidales bacterium]